MWILIGYVVDGKRRQILVHVLFVFYYVCWCDAIVW